jgi:hypothetical protein
MEEHGYCNCIAVLHCSMHAPPSYAHLVAESQSYFIHTYFDHKSSDNTGSVVCFLAMNSAFTP